jgi:hypothetical protein
MEKSTSLMLALGALAVLMNTGFQSTEKKEAPAINFKGTVTSQGITDRAENITISSLYENIPVYGIPQASETSPTTNVTEIRLDEIKAIRHQPGKASIKEFQKRDYVEIEIEFEQNRKQNYLVERSREINYEIPFADPSIKPLTRDVKFEAISEIIIQGYSQRSRKEATSKPKEQSAAKEAICSQVQKDIATLEKESQGMFSSVIIKIKDACTHLCG